jgi:sugar lactone lactonase YvrE
MLLASLLAVPVLAGHPSMAAEYTVEPLIAPAPLHGANGMELDIDGRLVVGSMMSSTIYRVERATGAVEVLVPPPRGIADDLAIGPDGTLAWTSTPFGIVHVQRADGRIERLATNLPMINSINFTRDGRLFAAQVTENLGNLYEIDLVGGEPPRVVVADLPGLNGFEISDDDQLYGPLQWGGELVRIDLDSGRVTRIADGFTRPVAVNLDSNGQVYVLDYLDGDLLRVDPDSGEKTKVAKLSAPVDNLAISDEDLIYVSHPCSQGVEEVDPATAQVRQLAAGSIGFPGGAVLTQHAGREMLLVSGLFCQHWVDPDTGLATPLPRRGETIWAGWIDLRGDTMVLSGFAFGQLQWLDAATGEPRVTLDGLDNPYAVRLMDDDSVWVAEAGRNRIIRLKPDRDAVPEIIATGLEGPVDFIVTDQGMFVSEAAGGAVSFVALESRARRAIRDGLNLPEGIALLPDGRLAVAEVGAKRLIAVAVESGDIEVLAENLPIGLAPFMGTAKTFLPTDVVVDEAGVIYLVADGVPTVLKVTALQ